MRGPRTTRAAGRRPFPWVVLLLSLLLPAAPALAEGPPPAPAAAPEPTFPLPFPPEAAFEKTFEGTIDGKYAFTMTLKKDGRSLTGRYRYQTQQKDLRLTGEIDPEANFLLKEFDGEKETGVFVGRFDVPDEIQGQWAESEEADAVPLWFEAASGPKRLTPDEAAAGKVLRNLEEWGVINPGKEEVCAALLADLKAGRFEFVRPIVRTDSWDNPFLQRYVSRCPALPWRETTMEPGGDFAATFGFAVYWSDVVPDTEPLREYVGRAGYVDLLQDAYYVYSLDECRLVGGFSGSSTRKRGRPSGSLNGMMRSRGQVVFYDLWARDRQSYHVTLEMYQPEIQKVNIYCSGHTTME